MKLYFYILDRNCNSNPIVRFEECEVIEKPKTYYPVEKFPRGVFRSYINKSDIGHVSEYGNNLVILTEPNAKMAKEIFTKLYKSGVRQKEESLAKVKAELNAILEMKE